MLLRCLLGLGLCHIITKLTSEIRREKITSSSPLSVGGWRPSSCRPTRTAAAFQHLRFCQQGSVPRCASGSVYAQTSAHTYNPSEMITFDLNECVCSSSSLQRQDCGISSPTKHLWDFAGKTARLQPEPFTQVHTRIYCSIQFYLCMYMAPIHYLRTLVM